MNELEIVKPEAVTPMTMIQLALQQGADIDKLKQLMDLQERWEKNEARKAFVVALNEFKADPPELSKNKQVSFETQKGRTDYKHATLDQVSLVVGRALSKHGLSHRWDVEQKDGNIKVTCVLTHSQGHSERVPMEGLPDTSGGKNSIQAIGSTVTYLQRYTLLAATGMAVKDQDTDGAVKGGLSESQLADFQAAIEASADPDALAALWKTIAAACNTAKDRENYSALKAAVAAKGKSLKVAA